MRNQKGSPKQAAKRREVSHIMLGECESYFARLTDAEGNPVIEISFDRELESTPQISIRTGWDSAGNVTQVTTIFDVSA